MNRQDHWRKPLLFAGRAAVSLGALAWLMVHTDWRPIQESLGGVDPAYCLAALVVYCLAQLVSSVRWRLLARGLGLDGPLRRFVSLYFVGMFFNLFLPTSMGGDVARALGLGGAAGRRLAAAASVLSERFSGLLALLLVGGGACLTGGGQVSFWATGLVLGLLAGAVLAILALIHAGKNSERLATVARSLSLGTDQRRRFFRGLGLSLIVQAASVCQVWLIGRALGLPVGLLDYAAIVPLAVLATMAPISVNGLGVREGTLVLLLAPLGVPAAAAISLGLIWFAVQGAASLAGAVVFFMHRFEWTERNFPHGPLGHHSDQGRAGQSAAAA